MSTLNVTGIIFYLCVLTAAASFSQTEYESKKIIDKVIENYGGQSYRSSTIEFDFRARHYKVFRNNGKIFFERFYTDSSGNIHEGFDNENVFKNINNSEIVLSEKKTKSIKESINSVVYFFSLPYLLNDKAVIKKYFGESTIRNNHYHLIEITFEQKGGGTDFQDRYLYWIDQKSYSVDYFAYYFQTNDGGSRFRRIHNIRTVRGIVFSDQENFTSEKVRENLEDYSSLFEMNDLEKISDVNIENISVNLLK